MKLLVRILNRLFKLNKKREESTLISEDEFIGYEAFSSGHRDKLIKKKQHSSRYCGRQQKETHQ
jgi:hypothetical protein